MKGAVWYGDFGTPRSHESSMKPAIHRQDRRQRHGARAVRGTKGHRDRPDRDIWVAELSLDSIQKFTQLGTISPRWERKARAQDNLTNHGGWLLRPLAACTWQTRRTAGSRIGCPTITGNQGAHETRTLYYTTAANSEFKGCGEEPAMAGLPCETTPAAQPGTSGLPELPTTKYTYNVSGTSPKRQRNRWLCHAHEDRHLRWRGAPENHRDNVYRGIRGANCHR